jgi:hypothetical protein
MALHLDDLLSICGPVFSMGKIIGDVRTRLIEKWLLNQFKRSTSSGLALANLSVRLVYIYASLFGLVLLLRLIIAWVGLLLDLSHLPEVLIVLISLLLIWPSMKFTIWQYQFLQKRFVEFCVTWEKETSFKRPWPLNHVSATFNIGETVIVSTLMFFSIPLYFALSAAWVCIAVCLAPFWGAEQVRIKLNPNSPHLFDAFTWFMSVIGVILKVRKA